VEVYIAAPASAAAIASFVIWSGVIGRWGDIVGVCIAPVIAQVIITLLLFLFFVFIPLSESLPGCFRGLVQGMFSACQKRNS